VFVKFEFQNDQSQNFRAVGCQNSFLSLIRLVTYTQLGATAQAVMNFGFFTVVLSPLCLCL